MELFDVPSLVEVCVPYLAVRLDLDDLGGEICLLDWGALNASTARGVADTPPPPEDLVAVSRPNESLHRHVLMVRRCRLTSG